MAATATLGLGATTTAATATMAAATTTAATPSSLPPPALSATTANKLPSDRKQQQNHVDNTDEFEERALARCAARLAAVHAAEARARAARSEARELKRALGQAQQLLFEERARLVESRAESDGLRASESAARARVQELLALTRAIETDPVSAVGGPWGGAATAMATATTAGEKTTADATSTSTSARLNNASAKVATALRLAALTLKAQLRDQSLLHSERLSLLLSERAAREEDAEREARRRNAREALLLARLERGEEALRAATRDFLKARRDKRAAESRAETAEREGKEKEAAARGAGEAEARRAIADARRSFAQRYDALREHAGRLREVIKERDATVTGLKLEVARLKGVVGEEEEEQGGGAAATLAATTTATTTATPAGRCRLRLAKAEALAARLLEANGALEARLRREREGWGADVAALRGRLATVGRAVRREALRERLLAVTGRDGSDFWASAVGNRTTMRATATTTKTFTGGVERWALLSKRLGGGSAAARPPQRGGGVSSLLFRPQPSPDVFPSAPRAASSMSARSMRTTTTSSAATMSLAGGGAGSFLFSDDDDDGGGSRRGDQPQPQQPIDQDQGSLPAVERLLREASAGLEALAARAAAGGEAA
jgi:hypothetical protein